MASAVFRPRHRHWHSCRSPGTTIQIVQPGRRIDSAQLWGNWTRFGHQQTAGGVNGRENVGRKRRAEGFDIPLYAADERPEGCAVEEQKTAAQSDRSAIIDRG